MPKVSSLCTENLYGFTIGLLLSLHLDQLTRIRFFFLHMFYNFLFLSYIFKNIENIITRIKIHDKSTNYILHIFLGNGLHFTYIKSFLTRSV